MTHKYKRLHRIETYNDGYRKVEFCKVCGAEGELLRLECSGEVHIKSANQADFFDKDVDKSKEQS